MIVRDFLICLLQMYLLEDLEKNMLPYRRENFLGKFLVYFVIALVMLGINHLESSIFNMVMIPVTYMIVSMVVFRGNIWKKLVIVCCYYVLAIIPEFLFATLTNAYGVTGASEGFGTEIEKTLALLLMSTMTFLFIKCINQVTRKRDYLTIENKTFTVLLMLPTATIIILGCVFYSNISFEGMNRVMVPVGASLLLLTNIFIFSVFDRFVEKSEEVKKMARLYQKSRAEIANLQYMNKVNEDNRAFLHDINKFICTVAGLMEEGENQEVKEIIPLADEIVADPTTLIRFAENAPGETWAGILDDIKKIQLPILVLHGLNDGWISPVEAVQIAKAARNNADIILFKGLGHSLSKVSSPLKDEGGTIEDEVIVRVVKWLKKNVE